LHPDLLTAAKVQDEIAAWIQAGHDLDEIETELIAPAPMSDDGRAALWLYAWALRDSSAARRRRALMSAMPRRARPRTLVAVH
jgi:hypothetical protein